MGIALAVALAAFVAAHAALVAGLARLRPRSRALAAAVMWPLAPWWGWHAGMRWRTSVWAAALALYAAGAMVAAAR